MKTFLLGAALAGLICSILARRDLRTVCDAACLTIAEMRML